MSPPPPIFSLTVHFLLFLREKEKIVQLLEFSFEVGETIQHEKDSQNNLNSLLAWARKGELFVAKIKY